MNRHPSSTRQAHLVVHASRRLRPLLIATLAWALGGTGCDGEAAPKDGASEEADRREPSSGKKRERGESKGDAEKKAAKDEAKKKVEVWTDSEGKTRPLVWLDLAKDGHGNECFPGTSAHVPEGSKVAGEFSGACVFGDGAELKMYFEFTQDVFSSFMTLDKRSGAQIIEETDTRLVVKKKDGFVVYDFAKWNGGYRHCSNQGSPVPTKELADQILKVCASAKSEA
jgi:hypothetical protein